MKRSAIIILALILFVSCGDDPPVNDNEVDDSFSNDVIVTDNDTEEFQEIDIEESENNTEHSDDDSCGTGIYMNPEWMEPEKNWNSWANLKAVGVIGDYSEEEVPAVYIKGKLKLSEITKEFSEGSFSLYEGSTLLASEYSYEFIDVDEVAGTAVAEYWDGFYQFSGQLVPVLKEFGVEEAGFGATVFFRHTFIDIKYATDGDVKSQQVRKNCYLAISKTEELEQEGEIYDVPVGDMYLCLVDNVDGSVGEKLYMMFKNEMTEDEDSILEFFNTRQDETIAVYGDEDFTPLCQCYDAEGNEVNCWQYDGPGGAEECPSYVSEEDCNPQENDDDVIFDDDIIPDDDFE